MLRMIRADEATAVPSRIAVCSWCAGRLNIKPIEWIQPFVGIDFYVPGECFDLNCEFQEIVYHDRSSQAHLSTYENVSRWLKRQLFVTEFGPENPIEHV